MSEGQLSDIILQRNGTSQAQRQVAALEPGFIPVEERTLKDWIIFAQQFAAELSFFDSNNNLNGNWEGFITSSEITNEQFVEELLAYVQDPDAFSGNAEKLRKLARPHLVLFISFLQLLGYLKQQFNGFTKKHLDFYYFDILGLTRKGPIPDVANVIIELAEDVQALFVAKGTRLLAGKDSLDKDLVYTTETDTVVSRGVIKRIKTWYTGKKNTTLQQVANSSLPADEKLLAMMQIALGNPNPGDPLPPFGNLPYDMAAFKNMAGRIATAVSAADSDYITQKLFLTIDAFKNIAGTYATSAADWERIQYQLKQAYTLKKQPVPAAGLPATGLAEPVAEEWANGYANADALATAFTSGNSGDTTLCFNTFGKGHTKKELWGTVPASIGFAIASPLLLLQEGARTITATFVLQTPAVVQVPDKGVDPFSFFLSTADGWLPVTKPLVAYGNITPDKSGQAATADIRTKFAETGSGPYNALRVVLMLTKTDVAIVPPGTPDSGVLVMSKNPVLAVILNPGAMGTSNYKWFKDAAIRQIDVQVKAEGLQALSLQNDETGLNPQKPFEPFGLSPTVGSRFYFAQPEISSKYLNTLTLQFEWMNKPPNLLAYYTDYDAKVSNSLFTAGLRYVDGNTVLPVDNVRLFDDAENSATHTETRPLPALRLRPLVQEPATDVLNQDRYFFLELNAPDFQHTAYPEMAARKAYKNAGAIAADLAVAGADPQKIKSAYSQGGVLNQPYTPRLKRFSIDYSTAFTITAGAATADDQFFHITAFGYHQPPVSTDPGGASFIYLMPQLQEEGLLYLGISGITAPQNLSLFFQMAEGSADPDLEKPAVNWSILSNNTWQPLPGGSIFFDTTNGLLNTGIIDLAIPETATSNNTLLGNGLYWLRAAVASNAEAIPDTVAVFTQAVSARFADDDNAIDHFLQPLPAGTITETADSIPQIKGLNQPFSSLKGKPPETDERFYTRVSERLRHKGRAITMWDYEYLVLEEFPEIYKAKCLPYGGVGEVSLIVIPDIKGNLPFNPFEPKAPANLLHNIQQYLDGHTSAWATVKVKNPVYTQVKVRIAVKIKEGYSESFFTARLQEDLIKYLAPWAYDKGADIFLDRRMDADVIVNFVAEQFYVEYASDVYLFTSTDGKNFTAVDATSQENFVEATGPGEILVSAPEHVIDIVHRNYQENNYSGIGYMKIKLDFRVG